MMKLIIPKTIFLANIIMVAVQFLLFPSSIHAENAEAPSQASLSSELLQGLPEDAQWVKEFDLTNPNIFKFIAYRIPGFEYYRDSLLELSRFPIDEQLVIIEAAHTSGKTDDFLVMDLRLPNSLKDAILVEAEENGLTDQNAIVQRGIPASLERLRIEGTFSIAARDLLIELSPNSSSLIAIIVEYLQLKAEGEQLEVEGEQLEAEIAKAQTELERLEEKGAENRARIEELKRIIEGYKQILDRFETKQ